MSKEARKLEIITTKDGSHSIFVEHLNEQYHSIHGAYQEAMHVFIKNGLATVGITPVNVLEIGFGTGLNAWLSSIFAKQHQCQINYCGLELFPLDSEIINQLNFTQQLDNPEDQLLFKQIHKAEWEHKIAIHPFFELLKRNKSVHEYSEQAQYELIYFDAFGPKKQPDMWTTNVFGQLYKALKPGGRLVTYCAQGQVKRDLKSVGFEVHALPGPPGKREMTCALKPDQ